MISHIPSGRGFLAAIVFLVAAITLMLAVSPGMSGAAEPTKGSATLSFASGKAGKVSAIAPARVVKRLGSKGQGWPVPRARGPSIRSFRADWPVASNSGNGSPGPDHRTDRHDQGKSFADQRQAWRQADQRFPGAGQGQDRSTAEDRPRFRGEAFTDPEGGRQGAPAARSEPCSVRHHWQVLDQVQSRLG